MGWYHRLLYLFHYLQFIGVLKIRIVNIARIKITTIKTAKTL